MQSGVPRASEKRGQGVFYVRVGELGEGRSVWGENENKGPHTGMRQKIDNHANMVKRKTL